MYFRQGDITKITEGIIVHGCNAQGVMGSGLAKQIKDLYPDCFKQYKDFLLAYDSNPMGEIIWYYHQFKDTQLIIANAITQMYYGRNPQITYVDYSSVRYVFRRLFKTIELTDNSINKELHIPDMIGCGLANGNRDIILSIIESELNNFDVDTDSITFWKYE